MGLTAVSDPQHGGFTAGSSPVSLGSLDELFVNLTVPLQGFSCGYLFCLHAPQLQLASATQPLPAFPAAYPI